MLGLDMLYHSVLYRTVTTMSRITRNLFLGSYYEAKDKTMLQQKKIEAVVICANHLEFKHRQEDFSPPVELSYSRRGWRITLSIFAKCSLRIAKSRSFTSRS